MKIKLINELDKCKFINNPTKQLTTEEKIFFNRGINEQDIEHYLNLSDKDISDPEIFGEELLNKTTNILKTTIDSNKDICVVVDSDCDGWTSSAILLNYIHSISSDEYSQNHVHWFMHEGKQHGLSDAMTWIQNINPALVIAPDGGTNDKEQLRWLEKNEIYTIILDHHLIEINDFWFTEKHPYLFLINSQLPQYPNKFLSGGGVVYQFCRYMDKIFGFGVHPANWYMDLVATALIGDMMSLHSFETRQLITIGLRPENIHNPLIYGLWKKNKHMLGDNPTAWGFTFYVVPLINALTRSGTMEEKELVFKSMLEYEAFKMILSNKKGHKQGEMEQIIDQALRACTNIKNRQTRSEEAGIELVEHLIKDNNMMEHKVLLFLLEPGAIKNELRGLVANKIMAKYQRPCCILTKTTKEYIAYQGSARGCDKVGVTEFKDICAATKVCDYTIG